MQKRNRPASAAVVEIPPPATGGSRLWTSCLSPFFPQSFPPAAATPLQRWQLSPAVSEWRSCNIRKVFCFFCCFLLFSGTTIYKDWCVPLGDEKKNYVENLFCFFKIYLNLYFNPKGFFFFLLWCHFFFATLTVNFDFWLSTAIPASKNWKRSAQRGWLRIKMCLLMKLLSREVCSSRAGARKAFQLLCLSRGDSAASAASSPRRASFLSDKRQR